ncbi:hypothetical protein [Avibacterium paragallinarum]|uniref:hypothetical protein n=1 Tax=Avibacterium paragallinarum TaxID=728 RepID=UPI00021ACF8A|nr:hypothetical protein [Avibacterium paragallinarum]QIR11134.1 hypothetical protein HBL79_02105 [Avibacterium paragallinarum]QIR12125.1 hypothetical protein HBL79_07705 [Avibacterium paragallinarum]QLD63988.1 hypothetical protein VY92_000680 [Avibacterium paragallinarum]QLD64254.1 hypothetical protein VY92_002195 [Avibacterium paragallinarum]QLD65252.1 hypothetical protein VY92_007805 [Avibacterium paragallinarum]
MQNEMKRYAISYFFKGKKWCSDVYANSLEEAQEKVKAMSQATIDGELYCSIYVPVKPQSRIARLLLKLLHKFS